MEPPKFQRKWEELCRSFNRLEHFYNGLIDNVDSFQGPKDYVLTFFRVGYELKEALKKTGGIKDFDGHNGMVENFVNTNPVIAMGLDITNQEKHVDLQRARSGSKIGEINTHIHMFDPSGKDRTELTVEINNEPRDCLEIARENMKAWKKFLLDTDLIRN